MSQSLTNHRNIEVIGFAVLALLLVVVLPLSLDIFRLNLIGTSVFDTFFAIRPMELVASQSQNQSQTQSVRSA